MKIFVIPGQGGRTGITILIAAYGCDRNITHKEKKSIYCIQELNEFINNRNSVFHRSKIDAVGFVVDAVVIGVQSGKEKAGFNPLLGEGDHKL